MISKDAEADTNVIEVTIQDVEFLGSYVRIYLRCAELGEQELRADVPKTVARTLTLEPERRLRIRIPPESIRLYGDRG